LVYLCGMEVDLNNIRRNVGRPRRDREKKTPIAISLGPDLLARLDNWARKRNLSRSGTASMALTESLERWELGDPTLP
jgi:hypothetical protein